jgi:serine/threonine-protein kinase
MLGEMGLNMKIMDKRYSTEVPADCIISQSPRPQSLVRKNRNIYVILSQGYEKLEVPNCLYQNLARAKIKIKQKKLTLGKIAYVYSDEFSPEVVIAQTPPPKTVFERKIAVDLLVSRGKREPTYWMPDFRGKELKSVRKVIRQLGLVVGKVNYQPAEEIEPGRILSQHPSPGVKIKTGTLVTLTVAQSKEKVETGKYIVVSYTLPAGFLKKHLRVVLFNQKGQKEVINGTYSPQQKVEIPVLIKGKTWLEIYVNGKKQEITYYWEGEGK